MNSMQNEYTASFYITAYLDLLGTTSRLNRLDEFFTPIDEHTKKEIAISAMQPLVTFRNSFNLFYSAFSKRQDMTGIKASVEKKLNVKFPKLKISYFSDSVILNLPILIMDGLPLLLELEVMFVASCIACLVCASMGWPIRGGIDLGIGINFGYEIVGNSLAKAYYLESKKAIYPRIIIGDKLPDLINNFAKLQNTNCKTDELYSALNDINKSYCENVKRIIYEDFDNQITVDYLNKDIIKLSPVETYRILLGYFIKITEKTMAECEEEGIKIKYQYLKKYILRNMSAEEYNSYSQ